MYEEIDTTEQTEPPTEVPGPSSAPSDDSTATTTTTTTTIASRRHTFPAWFPILTLLRYSSTIYVSEIATTCFESPGIHHSAVSVTLLLKRYLYRL